MATQTIREPRAKWHGTVTGYVYHKCRCKRCTRANREYVKEWRERKIEGHTCDVAKCRRAASQRVKLANGKSKRLCKRHDEMLRARRKKAKRKVRA
jgi:hypothetical protein